MNDRAMRPDQPRMTDAEFRIARHTLGVGQDWLAEHLKVTVRTLRNWEDGRYQIPPGIADEIHALLAYAEKVADGLAADIAGIDLPTIYTYRDDRDYYEAHPDGPYCAGWHRSVVARVAAANPRVVVAYYSRLPHLEAEHAQQLADVLADVYIDAAARSDPKAFLIAEIEDCLDDATGETAYPELLAAAQAWTGPEAAAVLASLDRRRNGAAT